MDLFGLASDLEARMAPLSSLDDEDRRGRRMRGGGRGDGGHARFGAAGVRVAPDDDFRRRSHGGSGLLERAGGSPPPAVRRGARSSAGPDADARPQAAVVKLASYAAGGRRVGALSDYLSREGTLAVETGTGRTVQGRAAVAEELARWTPGFENRSPSKDVASLAIMAPGAAPETMARALGVALSGRRFALQSKDDEPDAWRVVVVLAGPSGRLDVTAKGHRALSAAVAKELGAPGESVSVALTSAGHGASGLSYRLARLISRGPVTLSDGRTLSEPAEASAVARDWSRALHSRKVRDAMHLVLSAKPGTNEHAFQETARAFFADQFEGHRYLFAIHRDRQHLHAHAVIVMRGDAGKKLDPKIRDFAAWREAYAEHAREHGIDMIATRRLQRAAVPAYKLKDVQLVEHSASRERTAPDKSRRRIDAKRQDAIHVPTRSEGRAAVAAALQEHTASHPHAKADRERLEVANIAATILAELGSLFNQAGANRQEVSMVNRSPDEMRSDLNRMNVAATKIALLLPAQTRGQFHALANPILERAGEHLDRAMVDSRASQLRDQAERVATQENREARDAALVAETARRAASSISRNEGPGSEERARADAVASAAERSAARERQEAIAATRVAAELERNVGQAANQTPHEPESVRKLREEQARIIEERVRAKSKERGREDEL